MNFTTGKLVVVLAVLGVGLGLVNFFLVSHFNSQQQSAWKRNVSTGILSLFANTNMDFSKLDIDAWGEYRIHPNFVKGKDSKGHHDVAMVTHCTVNHLHYLLTLVQHWKGSISIAMMVPGLDITAAYKSIIGLHMCSRTIRERVSFHLVYPLSHPALVNNLFQYVEQARKMMPRTCDEFLVGMQTSGVVQNKNYANVQIPYPNNLLRNIARSNIHKDYIFMVDVDMMCNENLYHDFLKFAEDNNLFGIDSQDIRVFVVPAFESQEIVSPDLNKDKLIRLWDSGKIQPFYFNACRKCQYPTNYDKWKRHKRRSKGLEITHKVKWKDPWEPFYIGPYHVPMYDDRFQKYGFNRISQVCETHIAGYDFEVLDNVFLVHHGFKSKFHKQKDEENDINRNLFRKFKQELKRKYPNSKRRC